jgi:predicted lactoylglutathione lyase
MIGYITLGTKDLPKSAAFYDPLFEDVGAKRAMEHEHYIAWAVSPDEPMFAISRPYNGEAAAVGNGTMIALAASDKAQVNSVHAKALSLGATDEGAPGPRGEGFYAGYFRDLDGNKLNIFSMG